MQTSPVTTLLLSFPGPLTPTSPPASPPPVQQRNVESWIYRSSSGSSDHRSRCARTSCAQTTVDSTAPAVAGWQLVDQHLPIVLGRRSPSAHENRDLASARRMYLDCLGQLASVAHVHQQRLCCASELASTSVQREGESVYVRLIRLPFCGLGRAVVFQSASMGICGCKENGLHGDNNAMLVELHGSQLTHDDLARSMVVQSIHSPPSAVGGRAASYQAQVEGRTSCRGFFFGSDDIPTVRRGETHRPSPCTYNPSPGTFGILPFFRTITPAASSESQRGTGRVMRAGHLDGRKSTLW